MLPATFQVDFDVSCELKDLAFRALIAPRFSCGNTSQIIHRQNGFKHDFVGVGQVDARVLMLRKYKPDAQAREYFQGLLYPSLARLRVFMLRKYKPDAQARGYFRGFPDPSLARRACISTLRIFQFSLVLLSKTRNSILNAQHQNLRVGLVLSTMDCQKCITMRPSEELRRFQSVQDVACNLR